MRTKLWIRPVYNESMKRTPTIAQWAIGIYFVLVGLIYFIGTSVPTWVLPLCAIIAGVIIIFNLLTSASQA